jgi:hypothetical protein
VPPGSSVVTWSAGSAGGIPVVGIDRLSWAPSAGEVAIVADLAEPDPAADRVSAVPRA